MEPGSFDNLTMNEKLDNFRPPNRQKDALIAISNKTDGMVFLASRSREIIGYCTFHYPEQWSRWSKHPGVLEMGGIEISPDWRKCGIGLALLKKALDSPAIKNNVVIVLEFCWHWDLKGTGLGIYQYREMLYRFYRAAGFERHFTNDPDINEHPANFLMAWMGGKTNKDNVVLFERMLLD